MVVHDTFVNGWIGIRVPVVLVAVVVDNILKVFPLASRRKDHDSVSGQGPPPPCIVFAVALKTTKQEASLFVGGGGFGCFLLVDNG